MNILVTGGAGYIGSTLLPPLLFQGHRVRVLDSLLHGGESLLGVFSHKNFEFLRGDIRQESMVSAALKDMEAVVHLAAIVGDPACAREPESARSVNLMAARSLLAKARQTGIQRFVFLSTCSNYGKMKDSAGYVDETSELRPVSLYAETKVALEQEVLDANQNRGMCATALRCATVYGLSPRMRFDLTVNQFTMEMLTKKRLVLYGEQFWRPYLHVQDAARAIESVLEASPTKVAGEVFNVGNTKENYQKGTLVDMILAELRQPVQVERVHKEEDPRDYRVSFDKIGRVLGYGTTKSVKDGIREVINAVEQEIFSDLNHPRYRN